MRLVQSTDTRIVLEFSRREHLMLLHTVSRYPLVPITHHRLTKGAEASDHQQLLEQSLQTQQQEHAKRMEDFLQDKKQFKATKNGLHWSLKREDADWFLQVLNDVRVGSWLALGSPDEEMDEQLESEDPVIARDAATMHLAGAFQDFLLGALQQS